MNELSTQIRQHRKRLQISQQETARRSGVEQPVISAFERGKDVRLSTLKKVISALDLELVAVPREHLAGVEAVLRREPSAPAPPREASLLERFRVPDEGGSG